MTPQEALEKVAPRGRAAPKLKNALREDAYEVFEAWASQSAAAAAEDLAAATARSNDAGREAAAIKAAMDKKKKKKSMAEADYAPVAAGERVSALAVLRAAGPDYDLPWASRCATCHALLALGERYAGEEFEFGAGPAAGMAGDVALGALSEAFLLEDALCLSNDVLLGEPTRALYPVPPPLLRCLAHADWRPFLPGDPRFAAIRSCAPKKLRRTLSQIDGLLRRKDAPPPLSPVAAVDAELREHLDKVAEARGTAGPAAARADDRAPPGGLRRLAAEALADASTAAALRRLRAAATIMGDADARDACAAVAAVIARTACGRARRALRLHRGPDDDARLVSAILSGAVRAAGLVAPRLGAALLRAALRAERAGEAAAPETREPDDAGDFRKARRLALDAALALWPANRVARELRVDAAPSGASLVADLERLVADAAAAGGDDPRLPLWTLKLRWHRLALRGDGGGDADAVARDDGARAGPKLNRRAAETVAEIRAAAAAALRPQVESWEDAFAKTVVRRDGAVVGGDPRAAEARGAAAKVSFERPLPDAADAAEPPPPPPPDDGYDRHAAAYDALLERLKELSDAAAKKKDGAADAARPAEAEAPPPAKGAGWGAPGFELQHAMDYAFADVAPDAEAPPPPPPATADVAPPPPPDAA